MIIKITVVVSRFAQETNPNFKMWYHDIVMEYFVADSFLECTLDVLVLRRSMPALVKSIYELGWFTKKVRSVTKISSFKKTIK